MCSLKWPDSPPSLDDGVVRIRGWQPGDADAVFRACQDPAIQRWTTVPRPYLEEHAAGFVDGFARSRWAEGTGGPLAAADAGDDSVLGACGLVAVDAAARVGEIGYWVAPWARRRGVAHRAVRLLADWCFDQAGFERVELYIEPANTASGGVAEKLGCRREGVVRRHARLEGGGRDMAVWSLTRPAGLRP